MDEPVTTDSTEPPEPTTDAGAKLAVAPAGNPLTPSAATPANPPDAAIDALNDVATPTTTVCAAGDADNEKLGTGLTVSDTEAVWTSAPLVAVIVNG